VPAWSAGEPLFTVFDKEDPSWSNTGLNIGGYGFITAIHEFGHLLGLAHPHDGGVDGELFPGVSADFGDFGDYNLNQGIFTTMSYNDGWQSNPEYASHSQIGYGWQATPMALDIAAIQRIYGVNTSYKSGNDVYLLPRTNAKGTYWTCIWDTGGIDTISNAGSKLGCNIILVGAGWFGLEDAGGWVSFASGIVGGYTIAAEVSIENAIGGSGNDYIYGNELNNSLVGGDGNDTIFGVYGADTIDGGKGTDTVQFLSDFDDYDVTWSGNDLVFTDQEGDKSTVRNCETFDFNDGVKTQAQVAPERDSTPPLLVSAATNESGTKIVLTYNESLGTSVPKATAFAIKIAGKSVLASAVVASGFTLELGMSEAVRSSRVIDISYKAAKSNVSVDNFAIQDTSGNDAISFTRGVDNYSNIDGTPPQLELAATNLARNKVILTYNETLGGAGPLAKAFTIKIAGKTVKASAVTVTGSTIELSLPTAASASANISVSYKAPSASELLTNAAIQDPGGNDAISFTRAFSASAKLTAANRPTDSAYWQDSFQESDVEGSGPVTQLNAANAVELISLIGISALIPDQSADEATLIK
jgi:uncharacterized repeat protein (TIGR02059 family)